MAGKGSAPRPLSVSDEEFGKRFDAIDWSDRITAPTGHPPRKWTEQEKLDCAEAMKRIVEREAEDGR